MTNASRGLALPALLVAATLVAGVLDSFDAVVQGRPRLHVALVAADVALLAGLLVAFARGVSELGGRPLRALLLVLPLPLFAAWHLLAANWLAIRFYSLLVVLHLSQPPGSFAPR